MTTREAVTHSLGDQQKRQYDTEGFLIIPGLLTRDEVESLRERFDRLAALGQPIKGYWDPDLSPAATDPLARYPRVMHPHRWDGLSRRMLLHPRWRGILQGLLGDEPVACQSMFYFKPPGARGQALHQDNFYLQVQPGTCIAAWVAVDPASPENGGMYLVPGTHRMEIVCPQEADERESWTTHLVNPPKGLKAVPAVMQPGDVLFFNGSVIHGSGPNRSKTQWRRSWICHFMPITTTHVSRWYFPIYDFDGRELSYEAANGGGPCGDAPRPSSYDQAPG